ncbi:MAG TPA: hypothetical protein VLS93_17285 [Anaeromyxobacteraceae bacterium]|nr:hypothetical protein [Anaeromyxobacteraceae bacterium]
MSDVLPALAAVVFAFADLFQVPLVAAVILGIVWARRWPRRWRAVSAAAACWAAWIATVGTLVPYSMSSYLVLWLGVAVDPAVGWEDAAPPWRAASLGATTVIVLFWGVPTLVAWAASRASRSPPRPGTPRSLPGWETPAAIAAVLTMFQGALVYVGTRLNAPAVIPPPGALCCGAALALFVPIGVALAFAMYGGSRRFIAWRRGTHPSQGPPRRRATVPRVVMAALVGIALGAAIRSTVSFPEACIAIAKYGPDEP